MKRLPLILAGLVAIAGVAGGRVLLRDDAAAPAASAASATGRTVPVDVAPLPEGLSVEGEFVCVELRRGDGRYTARAQDGIIRNTTGEAMRLAFIFRVRGGREESVQRRFDLGAGGVVSSVTMESRSVDKPVERCSLQFAADTFDAKAVDAVRAAAAQAGCAAPRVLAIRDRDHIEEGVRAEYATSPPVGGPHRATTAATGIHDDPIPNEVQVHNLEHGHIGLQYRGAPKPVVDALQSVGLANGGWVFAAPYPSMDAAVAMTAWGVTVTCANAPSDTDVRRLAGAFVNAYRDRAPESIPGAR